MDGEGRESREQPDGGENGEICSEGERETGIDVGESSAKEKHMGEGTDGSEKWRAQGWKASGTRRS